VPKRDCSFSKLHADLENFVGGPDQNAFYSLFLEKEKHARPAKSLSSGEHLLRIIDMRISFSHSGQSLFYSQILFFFIYYRENIMKRFLLSNHCSQV
jgi:hypothetical protein